MRIYRAADGTRRLWIDTEEIERVVECEFQRANLVLAPDSSPVDFERFIEKHLNCRFEPYSDLPPDTLGLTEFEPGKRPRVRVNRDLTAAFHADGAPLSERGRWRATLAHEIAHVLLHRSLFEPSEDEMTLPFGSASPMTPIVCLKLNVHFHGRGRDWREVQANMCMAALLMPRTIFGEAMYTEARQLSVPMPLVDADARLVARLAAKFEVSRQAARIRVEGMLQSAGQTLLIP